MRLLIFLFCFLFFYSCYKDNEEAKKLDGSWKMNSFAWAGKDTLPPGQFTDSLGSWQFASCKSKTETCRGTASGFLGSGNEGFGWYIRDKGKKFTFISDEVKAAISQFSGDWIVDNLTENSFTISSENCGSCKVLGKETLSFSK